MGLRSGDWLGHSRTLMCFFLSHSFVALVLCFGSLSCWNTHPRPIYMAPSIVPLMRCSCPVPLAEKHPPKHNVFTSMFDGGDGVLGVIGSIPPPPPNTVGWVDAKELDFGLIWPQTLSPSSESFRCSLANFRRACTFAFLSRGTLPSWCSVLPVVFLVTMVPAALRSLTRSSRVVLGWFLTVLMIIETPRVRSCMEPQTEGDWQLFCVSYICE